VAWDEAIQESWRTRCEDQLVFNVVFVALFVAREIAQRDPKLGLTGAVRRGAKLASTLPEAERVGSQRDLEEAALAVLVEPLEAQSNLALRDGQAVVQYARQAERRLGGGGLPVIVLTGALNYLDAHRVRRPA
jgi:hypothetical protein